MAVGEIVDRASDRLVGLVESAAQRSQICRASPPSSSLERDFCPRRLARQKGPEDDVSAQRPEIGDHHAPEMAAKTAFLLVLSTSGFGRLGTLKNGQSAALVRLMLSIASPAEHFGDWLGSAEFLRSSSRLPLLVHPSSTPRHPRPPSRYLNLTRLIKLRRFRGPDVPVILKRPIGQKYAGLCEDEPTIAGKRALTRRRNE